ncbi:MAG: cryptochrome/photolyase family protein, partial [Tagaea sp.]
MPGALRFVLGDQLSPSLASLRGLDRARDTVLMVEVAAEATYVRHHKQKIAFLFSAMRHFAEGLRADGVRVAYVKLDDPANTHSFAGELARAVARMRPERVVVVEPGEWRVEQDMRGWEAAAGVPVEIREDDRFLCSRAEFAAWAGDRRQLRM